MTYKDINNVRRKAMLLPSDVIGEILVQSGKLIDWQDMFYLEEHLENYFGRKRSGLNFINLDHPEEKFSYKADWFLALADGKTIASFNDIDSLFEDYFLEVIEESTPLELMKLFAYSNESLTYFREDLESIHDFIITIIEEIKEEEE